jgi:hypothetical protein
LSKEYISFIEYTHKKSLKIRHYCNSWDFTPFTLSCKGRHILQGLTKLFQLHRLYSVNGLVNDEQGRICIEIAYFKILS